MGFSLENWNIILPETLLEIDKDRLKRLLFQFFGSEHRKGEKKYDDFYLKSGPNYFLQGDILKRINTLEWDYDNEKYIFTEKPTALLSNTCDVSEENQRLNQKQALFAPVIKLSDYIDSLKELGANKEQIDSALNNIKSQTYSNIFYLPPNPINGNDYIVFLDNIFWQPSNILISKIAKINDERFLCLNHFGFYLLITKLSYHFCRVPEEIDR
ncbi:MAG: hypothetical protein SFY56_12685 [Bacteroidota bacterium]|nr:hypothetical protein [Bacteroidota bacterium]